MRVAYFTESLAPCTDGVSRTLSMLASTLIEEGVEFRFFSPFVPDSSCAWYDRVTRVASVPFPPYPTYRVGLPYLAGIIGALREFRPDIIHIVAPTFLGLHGLRCAARLGVPAVASYHTALVRYFPYDNLTALQRLGWRVLGALEKGPLWMHR